MIKCSPEAFAGCQEKCHHCATMDEAYFLEGSDCDRFNQEVFAAPKTNADRIRAMSDNELAEFLADKYMAEGVHRLNDDGHKLTATEIEAVKHTLYCAWMTWLKQPAED